VHPVRQPGPYPGGTSALNRGAESPDPESTLRRPAVLLAATAACLGLPAVACADVFIEVPRALLGGPIASPLPAMTPDGVVAGPGRPSRAPGAAVPCRGAAADDCVVWGPGADLEPAPLPLPGPGGLGIAPDDGVGVEDDPPPDADTPEGPVEAQVRPAPIPAVAPTAAELRQAAGSLVSPKASAWLPWQRTTLRWKPARRATSYNVQVFRGRRRVLNAWSRDTRLRVPRGVLRQGRTYVWVVWPANGPRRAARFALPVGRSTFAVTLRPRIVFRSPGGRRRAATAEVRPHIPFGTLRLRRPDALRPRVPPVVTIDRRGRFTLPISKRAAERLGAILVDRGTQPPVGLRGPGRT
jgi:hypothetical protein